jgi:hypothetical protein
MNPLGNGGAGKQPPMNPMEAQIAEAIRFAQTFSSPEEYMKQLQQNNPQMFQKIIQMQRSVQDPASYANRILAERGIDPARIAGMLQRK